MSAHQSQEPRRHYGRGWGRKVAVSRDLKMPASVSFRRSTVAALDARASRENRSRSEIIEAAVNAYLGAENADFQS